MDRYLIESLREILHKLEQHLDDHRDEVATTLQRVARGELKMPETISPKEAEYARALFGQIAQVGPHNICATLQSMLDEPATLEGAFAFDRILLELEIAIKLPTLGEFVDKRLQAKLAVLLLSYLFYEEFHYPQPETGMYDISGSSFQKLKWLYRYWFNQLEVAEKGTGLEAFFASQFLDFYIQSESSSDLEYPVPEAVISVSCAGDLLAVDVLTPQNTPHLFDEITDFYSTADIVSANLESTVDKNRPVGRTQRQGQPAQMNTSEAMFQKFRDEAKINYFSTATNHAMDWGEQGVLATLEVLKKSGAYHSGTAASQAEQDDVVVVEKDGIKVALLSYTFDLNGYKVPPDKPYLANEVRFNDVEPPPDYSLIKKQIAAAKAKGAEWIIAYCHWGWEFEMYPHVNIVEAARKVIECGVDTILGNHAHVSQPAELIPRPGQQDALVIYAFGDFVSYHPDSRNSKLAYAIKFNIGKLRGSVRLFGLEALPIYIVNEQRDDGGFNCRIVKFFDVLESPDRYGLTDLEKRQLPHLHDKVWKDILSPISSMPK
ncbi:CapA family protein [Pseudomonas sp. TH49]|uniref:CapA family protein n=1 Tax=Pseudomonas sp. TH49 TaxID=2796413 RepID=UPI0019131BBA|nr:CapA family protein [Pseudomonas sp. TH49]MBK5341995.1 CapA family protein [Pseudomonas sp. TH49]